jgi:hypothetical protein
MAYERALEETPLRTKALTSCVGLAVADVIAQASEGGSWDYMRTTKLASFGLLWHGISVRISVITCPVILQRISRRMS